MVLLTLAIIAFGVNLLAFNTKYYGLKSLKLRPKHIDGAIMELALQRSQKSVIKYLQVKDINLK